MHHESLDVFIQCRFCEFFSVNKFDPKGGWEGFFGGVGSLGEFFLSKLDIKIIKGYKRHA